jgi:hypothetical protein
MCCEMYRGSIIIRSGIYRVAEKSPYTDQLVIRKTQLNSVAAANHMCTILHTVANLPFHTVLRAALCSVNLFVSEVRIVWVYGDFSATLYCTSTNKCTILWCVLLLICNYVVRRNCHSQGVSPMFFLSAQR